MNASCPNVAKANQYVEYVLSGKIPVNRYVKLACERHVSDLRKSKKDDYKYYFDERKAEVACMFIQLFHHTKGQWSARKENIKLEPWQCFALCSVFGWLDKEKKVRRFREFALYVPRKNGKSLIAAAIGLYMLSPIEGESGAEVYSGATSKKQAMEVFLPAKLMCEKNQDFIKAANLTVRVESILNLDDMSRFVPVIGNPGDGSSPSCAFVDEYHEHVDNRLFGTMKTGMMAREQPLMVIITTAGDNIGGPCYQRQMELQAMLEGTIEDERTFALIYGVDPGDDWSTIETAKKANPNYGVSVLPDAIEAALNQAKNSAADQMEYKTKHLNVWVGARDAYFDVDKWINSKDEELKLDDFSGNEAYITLDLASKVDIAAIEILIPQGNNDFVRFGKYYLPENAIAGGTNEHYMKWAKDGWITLTDGDMIDFNRIKRDIIELCKKFDVIELGFDPFQATMLITELMSEGIPCVEIGQTKKNFSDPMKMLDGFIRSGKMRHNGDPVMTWMIGNVVTSIDPLDQVFPRKLRDQDKIDGVVALIMALGRALKGEIRESSVYEERGLRSL